MKRAINIPGEDCRGKTVFDAITDFLIAMPRSPAMIMLYHRSKDFLLGDPHFRGDVSKNRRLDKRSRWTAVCRPPRRVLSSFKDKFRTILTETNGQCSRVDLLHRGLLDNWSDIDCPCPSRFHSQLLARAILEQVKPNFSDRFPSRATTRPRRGGASLTGGTKCSPYHCALYGQLQNPHPRGSGWHFCPPFRESRSLPPSRAATSATLDAPCSSNP